MSKVTVFGFPQSTYVRTTRIALVEKGVPYELVPIDLGSKVHRVLHPFGKMPAFEHEGFHLFETFAITRYIDEVFDGPPLQPSDAARRAVMTEWVSAVVDYVYPSTIRRYLMHYVRARMSGNLPDRAAIDEAVPDMVETLRILDRALAESPYLAGAEASLADYFLLPIVAYLEGMPESAPELAQAAHLTAWTTTMKERTSVGETVPPPLPQANSG